MKTTVPFGYSWPYRWKRASSALISVRSRGGLPRTPCGNQASVALSRRNRETPTSSPIQPLSRTGSKPSPQPSELPEIAQGQGIAGPRSQHLLKSPLRHLQLFAGEGVDAPLEIFDRRAIGCGGHTQTTKLVDRYRHLLSAHLCTTELTGRYLAPDRVIGRFRDQNAGLIVLIETLQPRRKVHRISDELVERPALLKHDLGHRSQIRIDQPDQAFRTDPLRERGKTSDVGEEDRHLPSFTTEPEALWMLKHLIHYFLVQIVPKGAAQLTLLPFH